MRLLLALLLSFALVGAAQSQNVLGNPIKPKQSAAAEGNHVFSSVPANLYSGMVTIGTSAGYLMYFNGTSAPADGAVTPYLCLEVPASTTFNYEPAWPVPFSTGIVAVFSTTGCFSKTASNAYFSAQVR